MGKSVARRSAREGVCPSHSPQPSRIDGVYACVTQSTRGRSEDNLWGQVFSSHLPWVLGIKAESLCLCGEWLNGLNLLIGHHHVIIELLHSAWHALGIC